MLARRSLLLARRSFAAPRLCGVAALTGSRCAAAPSSALVVPRRHFLGQTLGSNLVAHFSQVNACTSLSTLLYSPLGTAMLIVLAYNVIVICTKHCNYSMEITAKDYVQDQQLYVIMRYGILSCILLGMEVMFVEV